MNFDLLGEVIEKVSGESLSWAYAHYILQPLGLSQTYLPEKAEDQVPETYLQGERIHRPQFIRSTKASGGLVSTAKELRIFLQAFFQGTLFPKKHLLGERRPLQLSFYPILYSQGFMCVPVKKPFGERVTLLGHMGSTGSFAFYCPEKDRYLVGDFPQLDAPSFALRQIMRLVVKL